MLDTLSSNLRIEGKPLALRGSLECIRTFLACSDPYDSPIALAGAPVEQE